MRSVIALILLLCAIAAAQQMSDADWKAYMNSKNKNKQKPPVQPTEPYVPYVPPQRPYVVPLPKLPSRPIMPFEPEEIIDEKHLVFVTEAPTPIDTITEGPLTQTGCVGFQDYDAVTTSSHRWARKYREHRAKYTHELKKNVAVAVVSTVGWHAFRHAAAQAAAQTAAQQYAASAFGTAVASGASTGALATVGSAVSGIGLAYTGYKIGNYVLGKASLRYRIWQICKLNKKIKKHIQKVAIDSQDGMGFFGKRRARKTQEKIDLFYRWIVNAEKRIQRRTDKATIRRNKLLAGEDCRYVTDGSGQVKKCDGMEKILKYELRTEEFKKNLVSCTEGGESHRVIYRKKCV